MGTDTLEKEQEIVDLEISASELEQLWAEFAEMTETARPIVCCNSNSVGF